MDVQNEITKSGNGGMHFDKDTRAWYIQVASQFGLPTVLLGILVYFGVIGAQWMGDKIMLPVSQEHINFLKTTSASMIAQEKSTLAQERLLNKNTDALTSVMVKVAELQVETMKSRDIYLENNGKSAIQMDRMIKLLESIDAKTTKDRPIQ